MKSTLPFLVLGGGIAGMSVAIALRARGYDVELAEIDPQWGVYGAGITITGPTYRAFAALGMLDDLLAFGYGAHGGTRICAANGAPIHELASEPLDERFPPIGGIMRPKLHELLSRRTIQAGVTVQLGVTRSDWKNNAENVEVSFTDGRQAAFAAVIVADGVFSKSRSALFPDAPIPHYTGQYCWRLVARRPPEIDRAYIFMGGSVYAGLVPTSESEMYMWLLEARPEKSRVDAQDLPRQLARLMSSFGGILGQLRDSLDANSIINCRPLEAVLLPRPWHRGRIVLIGDAAHSTTPHLASGAGIAVEDAIVVATLLAEQDRVEDAFARFMDLRFERCRDVVDSSVAIGALQQSGASLEALGALIGGAEHRLRREIWPKDLSPIAGPAALTDA